ncbi:MAG: hypothetical protein ACKOAO_00945 [Oxalobacteraceae bacterium]
MEALMTLVVCLSGCGPALSRDDELGRLAGSYTQLCAEMQYLKQNHCPELPIPVMLQCLTEVESALSLKRSREFREGLKVLMQRYSAELPPQVQQKFQRALPGNENDSVKACLWLAQENSRQRFQQLQTIRGLEKRRD